MVFQNRKHTHARIVLSLALIAGLFGLTPLRASAGKSAEPVSQGEGCDPDEGSMWTSGPSMPDLAFQAQQELGVQGIDAAVEAKGYGETDSCDTYTPHGVDFTIHLADTAYNNSLARQALADAVLAVLMEFGKPNLGNVRLFSARGELIPVTREDVVPTTARTMGVASIGEPITKKVYVIVYDPLLSNGQTLTQRMHWNSPATITQQTIDFFSQVTNGKLNYTIVETAIVNDWPELVDGYKYTEQQYLAVWATPSLHHEPKDASYNKIVNSSQFDICGKLNRGEIDELWIYNGPWFGFAESTLVGPGAYPFNSAPVWGQHHCNRILPIMGPNVERTVNEAVHNFGHRTEATMTKVYGSWQQNNTSHTWNQFSLVKAQSPSYSYSGCGNIHYPPNSGLVNPYDYINPSTVLSNCPDFVNYPDLGDPLQVAQPITCSAWGCTEINYYRYWFGHFPANPGCGPDNFANDWWTYIANPGAALYPSEVCQPNEHIISGNAGAGGAVLSYTDGIEKHVTTDSYGNYFFMVSDRWSGRVTPSGSGYLFSPAFQDYTDVQTDLYVQDYTAEAIDVYVNATGDNTNSCLSVDAPCRTIQEAVNKAGVGGNVYVASGTYSFSTNESPNVLILKKDIILSGGWNSDFTVQDGVSVIDGADVNNGILMHTGVVVIENFIIQNTRSSNSGAIYMINGTLTLKRSVLRNNIATSKGGGVFIDNGAFNMINSTISGNRAGDMGGGIYMSLSSGASVNIQNSTISYNSASRGGGISQVNGTYNIINTIIANNSSTASNPDCDGTLATASFNIIENMTGCSITSGDHNLHVDPQIDVNLTGNLPLHVTLPDSAAVDAGDDTHCPALDQRGVQRPQGQHCDIGAYEYDDPAPQIPGPGTYDDRDAHWTFSNGWTNYDGKGPYSATSHYTNVVGSQAQFTFDGSKFAFTYVRASNRGSIDVYVDDVRITRINAKGSPTAWQQTWTSPAFTPGTHTVRVVHAGGGTYIDVDAIRIFAPPSVVPAGTYDDSDANWTFSSGWTVYTGAGPAGNTNHYTGVAGSDAQITFNGSRFMLTYVKASNRGLIDVYVDGTKIAQINAKNSRTAWQQTWTSPALTPGTHTVRFVHAGGGTYIDVDAITIHP